MQKEIRRKSIGEGVNGHGIFKGVLGPVKGGAVFALRETGDGIRSGKGHALSCTLKR